MHVLLVEDNLAEARLTQEALRETGLEHELHIVNDGEQALRFLCRVEPYQEAPKPNIILLDLNLPRKHGFELLRNIKSDTRICSIPVIVISNSSAQEDIDEVYRRRANCYLTKPADLDDLFAMVRSMVDFWFKKAQLPTATTPNLQTKSGK
jgi:chemotaxis family two-component system response regulator Rcp1